MMTISQFVLHQVLRAQAPALLLLLQRHLRRDLRGLRLHQLRHQGLPQFGSITLAILPPVLLPGR